MKKYFNISTLLISIIAIILLITSFDEVFNPNEWTENEDYLFPRFIASGIAILTFILYFKPDNLEQSINIKTLSPGLGIIFFYLLIINYLGFYIASMILFFAMIMVYKNPEKSTNFWRVCVIKFGISALFILVLYLLFTEMLQVYPPKGILL